MRIMHVCDHMIHIWRTNNLITSWPFVNLFFKLIISLAPNFSSPLFFLSFLLPSSARSSLIHSTLPPPLEGAVCRRRFTMRMLISMRTCLPQNWHPDTPPNRVTTTRLPPLKLFLHPPPLPLIRLALRWLTALLQALWLFWPCLYVSDRLCQAFRGNKKA